MKIEDVRKAVAIAKEFIERAKEIEKVSSNTSGYVWGGQRIWCASPSKHGINATACKDAEAIMTPYQIDYKKQRRAGYNKQTAAVIAGWLNDGALPF